MKARFFTPQDAVKIVSMRGTDYVFLCLNEQEVQETYPEMYDSEETERTVYEYDYAEIREPSGVLDFNDVRDNPEKYLEYEPVKEEPDSLERIRSDVDFMAMELGVEL